MQDRGINIDHVVLANGSGGTQAGLILGFKHLGLSIEVIGISVLNEKSEAKQIVADQATETAKLLKMDITVTPGEVTVYDDYIGEGYGIPTKACIEAIRLLAQTEAIFLDPVYTGKAMSGLIDLIRKDRFTKKDTVLFIHTGGVAADFAYSQELSTTSSP